MERGGRRGGRGGGRKGGKEEGREHPRWGSYFGQLLTQNPRGRTEWAKQESEERKKQRLEVFFVLTQSAAGRCGGRERGQKRTEGVRTHWLKEDRKRQKLRIEGGRGSAFSHNEKENMRIKGGKTKWQKRETVKLVGSFLPSTQLPQALPWIYPPAVTLSYRGGLMRTQRVWKRHPASTCVARFKDISGGMTEFTLKDRFFKPTLINTHVSICTLKELLAAVIVPLLHKCSNAE